MKSPSPAQPSGYRIVELQAENVKRLSAVEIRPDGNVVVISGKNGQGKTTVLDCIKWAIEGAKHIQAEPIRRGWEHARIRLDLGDVVITRTFDAPTKDGDRVATSVKVEGADGHRFPSPQAMLDTLFGELTLDPFAFTRMKAADQFDALKGLIPGIDFATEEAAIKKHFDNRTQKGRERDRLKGAAQAIQIPAGTPDEQVDIAALMEEFNSAKQHNSDLAEAEDKRDRAERLRAQASQLEEEADIIERNCQNARGSTEPIDLEPLRLCGVNARSINDAVTLKQRKEGYQREWREAEEEYTALTEAIEERRQRIKAAIADANLPVAGLSLGEGVVTLHDLPFDQASDAEQLRASVAIAMAMNTKLRVIRVHEGSLLDQASMAILAEKAEEHDYQIWIERVSEGEAVGFVIEDGTVKHATVKAAAARGKR